MTCAVSGVFDLVNKCHPSTIHYIIRRPGSNFDINRSNNFGQTPMMFAAATREPKIAEKIIEYLIGEFLFNYMEENTKTVHKLSIFNFVNLLVFQR